MYGLQEHELRFYCLFKKDYFSLLATSDFFCRHAYAYAHMRIIRHESDMAAYAWPSLVRSSMYCNAHTFKLSLPTSLYSTHKSRSVHKFREQEGAQICIEAVLTGVMVVCHLSPESFIPSPIIRGGTLPPAISVPRCPHPLCYYARLPEVQNSLVIWKK